MSRFFVLPVVTTVLALVGVRMSTAPAPVEPPQTQVAPIPPEEPEAAPSHIVGAQGLWEPAPPPPASAPKPGPVVIVLEPLPAAPPPKVEVVNSPVIAPQTTVVQAPVNNFYPVVEIVQAPPQQEVIETPVVVVCAAHRRAGCCLPRRPLVQQNPFFKKIPFLPPTPQRPRWNP